MNILTKDYEEPLTLTDIEKKIQPFLESLLNDKMEIQAYITTIKVLSKRPTDKLAELNSQAQKLFVEKKYTAAIAKWEEVLELDSENSEAIDGIEESKRILKELQEKKREIDKLNISAQQLYDGGKYREAIDTWKEVLSLDSENQTAKGGIKKAEEKLQVKKKISELSSQAQKLFEEKKYTEAIAKWEEVLKLDSENREAIEGREEAERILKKLKQLYDEGTCAAKAQKWKAAIATFRELVTLDSQYRDAAARLGEAEEKLAGIGRKVKKYCPECRYPNEHGLKYCTKCGAKLFEKEREVKEEKIKEKKNYKLKNTVPIVGIQIHID